MIALLLATLLAEAAPDRTTRPPVRTAEALALPDLAVETAGHARLAWLPVPGVRRVTVDVTLWRGALHLDGARSPAATVTGWEWATAAKGWSAPKLEERLALLDASVDVSVGDRLTSLSLDVPREHLEEALDVFEAILRHPTFPAADLKRDVRDALRRLRTDAPHSAQALASTVQDAAWFDPTDPRSGRIDVAAWERVRRADAVARHARLVAESPIEVLVAGDVDAAALRPRLAALVDGLGAEGPHSPPYAPRPPHAGRTLAVDVPDADQAVIVVRTPAPARGTPDAPVFQAIQHALGGHFLSRLNKNLREEKGLTYGAGSRWSGWDTDGAWTFGVEVAEGNVGVALHEVRAELDRMVAAGTTADEQAVFGTSVVGTWNTTLGTADRAAARYGELFRHAEDVAVGRARVEAQRAVRPEDTPAVAARWLGAADRLVLVVGDRKAVEAQLGDVGPVTWVSAEDAALGSVPAPR